MRSFFQSIDDFLRGKGSFAVDAPLSGRLKRLLIMVVVCGLFYGAVMGTHSGLAPGRFHQLLYSALKVPLLLLVTFLLCLPSFFVLNTVAGLREDFGQVLEAVVGAQACLTVVLASLAPVTAFFYVCSSSYTFAVFFNGVVFALASVSAQVIIRRYYTPLIGRSLRHKQLRLAWLFLYAFVGVQMAWVLRPFIGDPRLPVAFFREGAWGNAYVTVGRLTAGVLRSLFSF